MGLICKTQMKLKTVLTTSTILSELVSRVIITNEKDKQS